MKAIRLSVYSSKCRLDKFTNQRPSLNNPKKLFEEFKKRGPFHYLQFCYWKLGDLKQAVKSAFTFLVANPGDDDTLNNLHFYMEQSGFEREMLIDEWQYRHEAVNAYSHQEWLYCVNLFQESLQQFWEALEDCRSECEYLNNKEEINGGDEQNEWSVFITTTYLSVLQCKQSCVSQQSFLNGRFTKHLLLSHYEHLHLCQFNCKTIKRGREACQSVENALLLQPKNIVMRRNKLFYLNYFNGNVENDVSLFQLSKEIKNFVRREKMERQFLKFLEKEMNEEYVECLFLRSAADFFPHHFPLFQQLLINEFLLRISQLYEIEEKPIFEGIYCVSKGLFGKSNCERPTISVSINNFNCGQMGGEEFTGCVISFFKLIVSQVSLLLFRKKEPSEKETKEPSKKEKKEPSEKSKNSETSEEPITQLPNNYTNIPNPKVNESDYGPNGDFKIYTPNHGTENVSALRQILFREDPRLNGGKVPFAFQFCPPDLPTNETKNKCKNSTTGYLVCYVGQLDPERKDGIAIKYAVGNKNTDPIFKECTDKSLKSKNADKKEGNEPDYDYWNNAGPKHGLLVRYLSGGNFSFSASYLKKSFTYSVGEGNCLLMRLFEKNTFLTGFYATGPNASEKGIYPNEGKLYNKDFVKFANGLLIEDTNLTGPWLLGADVFLRNQSKFQLSTLITGNESCAPSFSYLFSKYAGIHSKVVLNTNL
uniref:Leprecan-like alpha-helical domain-containing protein n=1 Tax=Meloidogyne javanica TaxID=6303 RepID=A0A915LLM3_MELJA